jgi:hypothetical protein
VRPLLAPDASPICLPRTRWADTLWSSASAGNGTPASGFGVDAIDSSLSDLSLFDTEPSSVDDARGPLAGRLELNSESSPAEEGEPELSSQQMRRRKSDLAQAASPTRRLGSLSPESDLHGQVEYKVRSVCDRKRLNDATPIG